MMPSETETDRIQSEQELESPIAETPAPSPSRAFASSSLAAELRARAADKALAEKVTDTADGVKLPETLAESLALLRQVQATAPKDKFESKVRAIKLQRLAAHVHALSQSPPPPRIDQAAHWRGIRQPNASALQHIAGLYPKSKARKV
jgi:hypothetical protein